MSNQLITSTTTTRIDTRIITWMLWIKEECSSVAGFVLEGGKINIGEIEHLEEGMQGSRIHQIDEFDIVEYLYKVDHS
jgi:hypothetical protein